VLEEMKRRLAKVLSPTPSGELVGSASVKAVFTIGKVGRVGGCGVGWGTLLRSGTLRVLRNGLVAHEGKVSALKIYKESVSAVDAGQDCGVQFAGWEGVEVGDVVECYAQPKDKAGSGD